MTSFVLGALVAEPASRRPDLLAAPVQRAVAELGIGDLVGVVAIDPDVSDTSASRDAFGLTEDTLANCIVVAGSRHGQERVAACVVLADSRADMNGLVRRRLDVRKASFLPMDNAVGRTAMEYGAITPIGLPSDWPVLVDARVAGAALVVVGSGVRGSKLLAPGAVLAGLPGAEVVDGLGRPVSPT